MSVIHITKENFERLVMGSEKTVLLDFWATWCGPCKMIAPHISQIAEEREDILVGKIDVDTDPELAVRFGITSIPTLLVVRGGSVVTTAVGYRPKADIEKLLNA